MKTFTSYKGREIEDGQKIKVYFNLHNGKYSAIAMGGTNKGLVLGHFDEVVLSGVTFIVSEAGRQRVLQQDKKNVHAYAVGTMYKCDQQESFLEAAKYTPTKLSRVRYNPYQMAQFHAQRVSEDESLPYVPVTEARWVGLMNDREVFALGAE